MPLVVEGVQGPVWPGLTSSRPASRADGWDAGAECVHIALINNMPDSALADTELQFFELLHAASGNLPTRLTLFSLPDIRRNERGQERLDRLYFGIHDLWKSRLDAVIVTGTEPHQQDLRQEPYWRAMAQVLDWAEENTVSTVLSCLAAHAGVLHSDGIGRHRLGDKQFGVFDSQRVCDYPLTMRTGDLLRFPHSRWNEVRAGALTSCGYTVLTQSADAGVDLFVKKKRKSLFVHFQGHPEYDVLTLLKEYRRDAKRFLKQQRETYPSMPLGYFNAAATEVLTAFREYALANPSEEVMARFPEAAVASTMKNTWRSPATRLYRNWLQYIASRKADTPAFAVMPRAGYAECTVNTEIV